MTWLLKLYPPGWRRRYGAELSDLLAAQHFSFAAAIDLIAGAIDAWLNPQLATPAASPTQGETTMIGRIRQIGCASYRPAVSTGDAVRSATVMLGGTLAFTLLWLWTQWRFKDSEYLEAVGPMAYFLPYLLSLHFTSLKGRSAGAQAILIAALATLLTLFFLLVGWLGQRI